MAPLEHEARSVMSGSAITIKTKDGQCDAHLFHPSDPGKWPVVIYYMDGVGIRPALFEMAERFAQHGYAVLLPNLYYRLGPAQHIDPATSLADPVEREKMMERFQSLNNRLVAEDTGAFIAFLESEPSADASRIGCVGYCMGGAFALTAAANFPDRVRAAASIHGAGLAVDRPDSPHLLAERIRAKIYIGVSEIDPYLEPGETERLKQALDAAKVVNNVEIYPGVQHGFAVPSLPIYDRAASEQHWVRVLALFADTLGGRTI